MKQHYVILIALSLMGYIHTSYGMDHDLDMVLLALHRQFPSNTWIANARDRTKPEIRKEVEVFIDTYANRVNYNCYAALDLDPDPSEAAIKNSVSYTIDHMPSG